MNKLNKLEEKLKKVLIGILVLSAVGITYVVVDLIEFEFEYCGYCEPRFKVVEKHQSKYQHWTDMNKRRDGE